VITYSKAKLGKDYLSISFLHYLSEMVAAYKRKGVSQSEHCKQEICDHYRIARLIQCPRVLIKFSVRESIRYELKDIEMG
jgi:hypothetical protein